MSNLKPYFIKTNTSDGVTSSVLTIAMQTTDNSSFIKNLICTLKEVVGNLEEETENNLQAPRVFSKEIFNDSNAINALKVSELLNYSQFNPNIFNIRGLRNAFNMNDVLWMLNDGNSENMDSALASKIIIHVCQNLILDSQSDVENLLYWIVTYIKYGSAEYIIKSLCTYNPKVSTFIKDGLSEKIIVAALNDPNNLVHFIENGLMKEKVDVDIELAKRVINNIHIENIFDFYFNIRDQLKTPEASLEILRTIVLRVIDFDCEISLKINIMPKIFSILTFKDILQFVSIVEAKSFVFQLHSQGLFEEHLGHLDQGLALVTKFIESYPYYIAKKVFLSSYQAPLVGYEDFKNLKGNPINHHSYRQIKALVSCILDRKEFTLDEKSSFIEKITTTYPPVHLECLFQSFRDHISPSRRGPEVISNLISILIKRSDLSSREKLSIFRIFAYYPYNFITEVLKDIRTFVEDFDSDSESASEFMVRFIIALISRANLKQNEKRNIFLDISGTYSIEIMAGIIHGIETHIQLNDSPDLMVKVYGNILYGNE